MKLKSLLASLLISTAAFSQNKITETTKPDSVSITKNVFSLGEIIVTAPHKERFSDYVTKKEMERQNKTDVSRALDLLPGVMLSSSGRRNESMVTVRGFDLRAVPVYMDGIPVYVPYDGYVDLARFTTFDLSVIDVSKGFSSMLYGPNSLGGAINLISLKPQKKLQFDGAIGIININGYRGNINIGSNIGKFYLQGGLSYLHRDAFTLSRKFKPHTHENGGERKNSYNSDQKINLKFGWTPNANQEYVLGYINQQGAKGIPVYAGDDTLNVLLIKPRYWKTPYWDKETFYFLSNSRLNQKNSLKTRFYYDIFKNAFYSYDDSTYTTQLKPYSFQSFYNDYSYGGSAEFGTLIIPRNELKFSVHYKEDVHRENNLNEPVRRIEDNTFSIAAEDVITINKKLEVIPGISYNVRKNIKAQDYDKNTNDVSEFPKSEASPVVNGQIGAFYSLFENHKISLCVSYKSRFATIKDRYSYRMGTAIPNPSLKPESAYNYELNYFASFNNKIKFKTAVFYSHISNIITEISNVQPGKSQMQNAGKAEFTGVEAEWNYNVVQKLWIGTNYTYIERHNLSNPNIYLTDVPKTKVTGYVQAFPVKLFSILLSAEYNSSRYSTSYGTSTGDFTLVNTIVNIKIWKYLQVEAGINNILDRNYMLVEGYPEEGRNFFVTLRFFNTQNN